MNISVYVNRLRGRLDVGGEMIRNAVRDGPWAPCPGAQALSVLENEPPPPLFSMEPMAASTAVFMLSSATL